MYVVGTRKDMELAGIRKDMELLEKRYLDSDFTPFLNPSEDTTISEQNDSPGMT